MFLNWPRYGDQRRRWHPTPVLLPGKFHGWRSLVGCSPWGHKESDTTERLHFHFSLSCIGEGNGNPLQCSCLENPRYGGAWWAGVYGVAQSRTRLKRLSSNSSSRYGDLTQHLLGKLNVLKELQDMGTEALFTDSGRLPSPQGTYLGRAELQQTSGPHIRVSLIAQSVKALPAMQETRV